VQIVRPDKAESFTQHRALLFSIAYRMLGSASDAEDVLQDAYLRWQSAEDADVRTPRSYLSAVVTRLCIDELRSARARREVYVGPWLPEPILTNQMPDMTNTVELSESLSFAFLLLLEKLSPVERAVFLLREVFDYEYSEIASIVDKSEANCRQMVRRARQHLREKRPRFEVSREEQEEVTRRFVEVCGGGDMQGLLALLAPDVTLASDGGGKVQAARNVIHGASNVARFILGVLDKVAANSSTWSAQLTEINGQPGIVMIVDGKVDSVTTLDYAGDRIAGVNIVINPDKLGAIQQGAGSGVASG